MKTKKPKTPKSNNQNQREEKKKKITSVLVWPETSMLMHFYDWNAKEDSRRKVLHVE